MKPDNDGVRCQTTELDRQGLSEHVLRRFGAPVRIPTAESVVGDATHARGKAREDRALIVTEERTKMLRDNQRAKSVDLEHGLEHFGTDLRESFLGAEVLSVKDACDIDDQVELVGDLSDARCSLGDRGSSETSTTSVVSLGVYLAEIERSSSARSGSRHEAMTRDAIPVSSNFRTSSSPIPRLAPWTNAMRSALTIHPCSSPWAWSAASNHVTTRTERADQANVLTQFVRTSRSIRLADKPLAS